MARAGKNRLLATTGTERSGLNFLFKSEPIYYNQNTRRAFNYSNLSSMERIKNSRLKKYSREIAENLPPRRITERSIEIVEIIERYRFIFALRLFP